MNSGSTEPDPLFDDLTGSESVPSVLRSLVNHPDLISDIPEVVYTQTRANTGLRVSYTESGQISSAPLTVIEEQWSYMQSCLMRSAEPPLVLVRENAITPFTARDDVVRNEIFGTFDITSVPVASATLTDNGSVVQISVMDFDGSLGMVNFNLRSILGRHLWLSAGLPERNYPYQCARDEPSF